MLDRLTFTLRPMTAIDAQAIATWHDKGLYTFYDASADPDDLAELLTPTGWGESYFSVDNAHQQFVAFFQFKPQGDSVDVGLGLHPVLTGTGVGLSFVLAGLTFAQARFAPQQFRLTVATFNE
jgi:ribosomal-protein-alanine N-acetyltransferase